MTEPDHIEQAARSLRDLADEALSRGRQVVTVNAETAGTVASAYLSLMRRLDELLERRS